MKSFDVIIEMLANVNLEKDLELAGLAGRVVVSCYYTNISFVIMIFHYKHNTGEDEDHMVGHDVGDDDDNVIVTIINAMMKTTMMLIMVMIKMTNTCTSLVALMIMISW